MPKIIEECVVCLNRDYAVDAWASNYISLTDPFKVLRCSHCGMRWLNPQPTKEEYTWLYAHAYFAPCDASADEAYRIFAPFGRPLEDYEQDAMPRRLPTYQARLRRLRHRLPAGGTLLDIGAGFGDFLAEARRDGWDVQGIELSKHGCERAREKHRLMLEEVTLADFDSKGKNFDIVHLSHVFEHLVNPAESITQLKRLMHATSLLVIEVPNQFDSLVDRIVRWKNGPYPTNLHSIHHPYFTIAKLCCRCLPTMG